MALIAGLLPRLVTLREPLVHADAIVVLGGDIGGSRVAKASALFRQGLAPKLVVSGGKSTDGWTWADHMRLEAIELGVPAEAIVKQDRSLTTAGDAELTAEVLGSMGARRAILVTSSWHSRRASWLFRSLGPDIEWVSCPVDQEWSGPWVSSDFAAPIVLEIPKMLCVPLQILASLAP